MAKSKQQVTAWAVSMDFAYGVIGAVLVGLLVDFLAGTSPWGLIIGAVLGLIGAGYRFVKEALAMNRRG